MSLSRWFRDYLYIPLGGNRGRRWQTYRNLVIVFLLTRPVARRQLDVRRSGARYHGAAAAARARDRRRPRRRRVRSRLWQPVTIALVMLGWILFRSPSIDARARLLRRLPAPGRPGPGRTSRSRRSRSPSRRSRRLRVRVDPAGWVTGVRLSEPRRSVNRRPARGHGRGRPPGRDRPGPRGHASARSCTSSSDDRRQPRSHSPRRAGTPSRCDAGAAHLPGRRPAAWRLLDRVVVVAFASVLVVPGDAARCRPPRAQVENRPARQCRR